MGIFVKNNISGINVGSKSSNVSGKTVQSSNIDISNIERGSSEFTSNSNISSSVDFGDLFNDKAQASEISSASMTNGSTNIDGTNQSSSSVSQHGMANDKVNENSTNQQTGNAQSASLSNEKNEENNISQATGRASSQGATSGGNQGSSTGQQGGSAHGASTSSVKGPSGSKGATGAKASGNSMSGGTQASGRGGSDGHKAGGVEVKSTSVKNATRPTAFNNNSSMQQTGTTVTQKTVKSSKVETNASKAEKNTGSIIGKAIKWFVKEVVNVIEVIKATEVVIATSVLSAVGNIVEAVVIDGLVGYVVAGALDLLGADDVANDLRKFAARDQVGEINKWFYEETDIGRQINELSAIKYDSAVAKGITSLSETVIKIAAATAISIVPGGIFIVAGIGALEGIGNAAESAYQNALANGEDDLTLSVWSNLGILGSGVLDAVAWIFNAKLGQGLLNIAGDIGELGIKEAGTTILKQIISKETLSNALKPSNLLMNLGQSGLQSGGKIGPIFSKIINGEDISVGEWGDLALTFGLYFIINTVEDSAREYVSGYKAGGNHSFGQTNINEKIAPKDELDIEKKSLVFNTPESLTADNHFIKNSLDFNDGTYGVDQGAFRNLIKNRRLNNDWLKDKEEFRKFLIEKFPEDTPADTEDYLNHITNSEKVNNFTKDIIIEYITKNTESYDEAFNIYSKSFTPAKAEYYDKIVGKYMEMGLSEEDVVNYLLRIDNTGACSYAAQANGIAAHFADKEELFKEKFGFDLYREVDGKKVINSQELLAELYTYANTKSNVPDAKLFDMIDGKLKILSDNPNNQVYLTKRMELRGDILQGYLKSKSIDFEYQGGQYSFDGGYWDDFIEMNCIPSGMKDSNKLTEIEIHDKIKNLLDDNNNVQLGIYRSENAKFTFKNSDGTINITTNDWNEGDGHSVFVTDITDTEVIISSWGKRLKISLEDFVGNSFNIVWSKITE